MLKPVEPFLCWESIFIVFVGTMGERWTNTALLVIDMQVYMCISSRVLIFWVFWVFWSIQVSFLWCFRLEQNDFIDEASVIKVKGAKSIVPNVISVVEVARQRGILVIWVFSPFLLFFFSNSVLENLQLKETVVVLMKMKSFSWRKGSGLSIEG